MVLPETGRNTQIMKLSEGRSLQIQEKALMFPVRTLLPENQLP